MLVAGSLSLLAVALAYEPLRWLTTVLAPRLQQDLGGVGGVGGLTNMAGPTDNCTSTIGGADAPYCFEPGVLLGFTPFALFMLGVWVLPLALAAAVSGWLRSTASCSRPCQLSTWALCSCWLLVNMVWFGLPLAQYAVLGNFYHENGWYRLLGVSIAAAYPLSWHLALVAIPAAAGAYLPPLLGISKVDLLVLHRIIGRSTLGWAAVHAGGELAFLASQSELRVFNLAHGENLLFLSGAATAALALAIAISAAFRKHPSFVRHFRSAHRSLAAILLLLATAHWWPFALLLCPAVAVAAVAAAARARGVDASSDAGLARALATALLAAAVGVAVVWPARQSVMSRPHADTYSPFVFPPLALAGSWLAARVAASCVLASSRKQEQAALPGEARQAPLLDAATDQIYAAARHWTTGGIGRGCP